MNFANKYFAETEEVKTAEGCWNVLNVKIFQKNEDGSKKQIGGYKRNYHDLMYTFCPFQKDDKEYALYSDDYTSTSIMELPSCKFICGEKPESNGFCPVDYYVPYDPECGLNGYFGFISGCIWGDDSSWKVQYLDFSEIEKGIFKRTEKFGYLPLFDKGRLKDNISMRNYFVGDVDGEPYNDTKIEIAAKGLLFDLKKDYSDKDYMDDMMSINEERYC